MIRVSACAAFGPATDTDVMRPRFWVSSTAFHGIASYECPYSIGSMS
jgi:hypothetical protein